MSDFGIEGFTEEDRTFAGSRFADVREAIFANPYPRPFPRFPVTLWSVLRGLLPAAKRSVDSQADLRWGPDRKGYRRLLHPNGICLTGTWRIDEPTPYSGYFSGGSRGLVIARYSTCCTETRSGFTRSLAMVGRVYPTTERDHPTPLPTASFITQEDIGGADSAHINDAIFRNAPDTTLSRRGSGFLTLIATGIFLGFADKKTTIRQLYEIAELGKKPGEPTRAPEFMQLSVVPEQPTITDKGIDLRDEILEQIAKNQTLSFAIETSDTGVTKGLPIYQRRTITAWRRIGTMTFGEAVASYNGDHVIHFNHPPWRSDRNDPATQHRRPRH